MFASSKLRPLSNVSYGELLNNDELRGNEQLLSNEELLGSSLDCEHPCMNGENLSSFR